MKQVVDELGNVMVANVHASLKLLLQPVPFDVVEVPTAPSPDIPPIETLPASLQALVTSAQRLMEKRPIFTRRAFMNSFLADDYQRIGDNAAKRVYQYCGYTFTSGPWRDTIVRFGLDPRKDAKYRVYQTMMFMLDNEPNDNRAKYNRSKPDRTKTDQVLRKESHLFDGENVSKDGKVWQVGDITDPFLKDLLSTTNIRTECHVSCALHCPQYTCTF